MLDDGVGFSLVPWRPVMEAHLGRELRGRVIGMTMSLTSPGRAGWDGDRRSGTPLKKGAIRR